MNWEFTGKLEEGDTGIDWEFTGNWKGEKKVDIYIIIYKNNIYRKKRKYISGSVCVFFGFFVFIKV